MAIKYKWLAGTLRDLIKKDVKNQLISCHQNMSCADVIMSAAKP